MDEVSSNIIGYKLQCVLNCSSGYIFPSTFEPLVSFPPRVLSPCSGQITCIALGVPAALIICLALFFLGVLYHRGLAIRHKRAMRRYLESGEVRRLRPNLYVSR